MAEFFYTSINFEAEKPLVHRMNKILTGYTEVPFAKQAAGQIEVHSPAWVSAGLARSIRGR